MKGAERHVGLIQTRKKGYWLVKEVNWERICVVLLMEFLNDQAHSLGMLLGSALLLDAQVKGNI